MRTLVVGHGLIGAQRVQALARHKGVSEILVCDPRLPAGQRLSPRVETVGEAEAFGRRYDAAFLATPHDTAVELLPRILRLAPFVLAEKPLGRSAVEAECLAAAATGAGSRLFVGFNYRFLRNIQHARGILSGGEFGRVLAIDGFLGHGAQPGYEASWKIDPIRCGGGVCIDPGVHMFDVLCWLFGDIQLIRGWLSRSYWPIRVEDHASLTFRLPNGAPVSLVLSLSSWQSRLEITVELERAQLLLRGRGKFYGPQQLVVAARWPWLQPDRPRESWFDYGLEDQSLESETSEFLDVAAGARTETHVATAEEAVRAMRLVDACYRECRPAGGWETT